MRSGTTLRPPNALGLCRAWVREAHHASATSLLLGGATVRAASNVTSYVPVPDKRSSFRDQASNATD